MINTPSDNNRYQLATQLAHEDKEALMRGDMVIGCATPFDSPVNFPKFRGMGFYIADNWADDSGHLFIVFLNPLSGKMDVATGYNIPGRGKVNIAVCRGPEDFMDCYADQPQFVVEHTLDRDINIITDPDKRLAHKVSSIIIPATLADRKKLGTTLEEFRELSRKQIKEDTAPLHYDSACSVYTKEKVDIKSTHNCQSLIVAIYNKAFNKDMPIPDNTWLTLLNEKEFSTGWKSTPARNHNQVSQKSAR